MTEDQKIAELEENPSWRTLADAYMYIAIDQQKRISTLETEVAEQARLLGASGSREAALLTKIAELEADKEVITFFNQQQVRRIAELEKVAEAAAEAIVEDDPENGMLSTTYLDLSEALHAAGYLKEQGE